MAVYRVIRLFSKKRKDNEHEVDSTKAGKALIAGGIAGNTVGGLVYSKSSLSGKTTSEEVSSKLKELAKKKGVETNEIIPTGKGPLYSPGRKTIYTDGSKSAAALSHELGHADYHLSKNSGKIGRAAHKAYFKTGGGLNPMLLQPAAAISAGVVSGKRAAKLEAEGKKQSKLERHAGWAVPTALSVPVLVSEGLASRKGLKFLKNSGASKELRKAAKKELTGAWGTYAGLSATSAGIGELSRGLAYKKAKRKIEEDKKLEESRKKKKRN